MSRLSNMWSKIARSATDHDAHIVIPASRVLDRVSEDAAVAFEPHRSYFEIRLKQMFLRDRREYVRDFVALSSFNTEFLFAGERMQAPLVVGPSMLANAQQVAKGDQIEFLNTRLVGPCPYEGDDIELFAGLFRMTTNDWAKRALSLLEVLAKTFDTSKLSASMRLAKPLAAGIEGFFGMEDIEFRLGKHLSFSAPKGGGVLGEVPMQGSLQPTFLALLRTSRAKLDDETSAKFWVEDGRLFHGESADELVEFRDCDFMLLHIAPLESRSDYTSFDFHQRHWRKIEDLLVEQKIDDALATFRLLAASLVQCDDIVRTHRFELLKRYRELIDNSVVEYEQLFGKRDGGPMRGGARAKRSAQELSFGDGVRGGRDRSPRKVARGARIEESDLAAGIRASARGATMTPEQMLASVLRG